MLFERISHLHCSACMWQTTGHCRPECNNKQPSEAGFLIHVAMAVMYMYTS